MSTNGPGPAGPAPDGTAAGDSLRALHADIVGCHACPRLVEWRGRVAEEKRAAFRDERYWGRPVPGFGDRRARIVIVGLAPAAHGANRTGRIFTGDRSGDFLFAALHRCGFANQPESVRRGDGLHLRDVWITSPVRCAPPQNKPTPQELATCRPFIERELALLRRARVFVALGGIGWAGTLAALGATTTAKFGHGAEGQLSGGLADGAALLGSYHVSQQNTFTGRLTPEMLDAVLRRAGDLAGHAR